MFANLVTDILLAGQGAPAFVIVWLLIGLTWIGLDRLNDDQTTFIPRLQQPSEPTDEDGEWAISADDLARLNDEQRETLKERRRALDDAKVRSSLRDAYGTSSFRLGWDESAEAKAIEADNELVDSTQSWLGRAKAATITKVSPVREAPKVVTDVDDAIPRGRWKVGESPLMQTPAGKAPTNATLRSRVWKNHAWNPMWGPTNQERMRKGRPPQRFNPLTNKTETGVVSLESLKVGWLGDHTDPFAFAAAEGAE